MTDHQPDFDQIRQEFPRLAELTDQEIVELAQLNMAVLHAAVMELKAEGKRRIEAAKREAA